MKMNVKTLLGLLVLTIVLTWGVTIATAAERIDCLIDREQSRGAQATQNWPVGWTVYYDVNVLLDDYSSKGINFDLSWAEDKMEFMEAESSGVWTDSFSVTSEDDSLTWLNTGTALECTNDNIQSGEMSFLLTETPNVGTLLSWDDDRLVQRCGGNWGNLGGAINDPGTTRAYGDLNCDGSLNSLDIDPYVKALLSAGDDFDDYYADCPLGCGWLADCNEDGTVNSLDTGACIVLW